MHLFTYVAASCLPGLLWVWFFYRQDRGEEEPKSLVLWTFVAGMAAVVPAAVVELPLRGLLGESAPAAARLAAAIVGVGLVEEGLKLLAAYTVAFRRRAFNEPADGIFYSVTASLGFAALENLMYALTFGLAVAPVRAVVTSLAHASFGGVAGLYLGLAKVRADVGAREVWQGLGAAALLHGLYDYFLLERLAHPLLAVAVVAVTYRFVARRLRALGPPRRAGD